MRERDLNDLLCFYLATDNYERYRETWDEYQTLLIRKWEAEAQAG